MNKHQRQFNLPSISTILRDPPSPPPPIIVINEDNEQIQHKTTSFTLSPILSPIDSNASSPNTKLFQPPISPLPSPSMLSLPSSHPLPPLQGDDPPRRLRHPSISSIGSTSSSTTSTKPNFNSLWNSSTSTCTNGLGITSPITNRQYSRSPSPSFNHSRSPSPLPERPPLPPSTQIILSESGQPILKRRRGRPPSLREPSLEGGWTFLTPTVWDVKGQETEQQEDEEEQQVEEEQKEQHNDALMSGSMAAFTSSNMDMVLQMPRKKRGRKPKTHIVGNSCFVWKDITAAKRSTRVMKPQ